MQQVLLDAKTAADTARNHERSALAPHTLARIDQAYNTALTQAKATIRDVSIPPFGGHFD